MSLAKAYHLMLAQGQGFSSVFYIFSPYFQVLGTFSSYIEKEIAAIGLIFDQ